MPKCSQCDRPAIYAFGTGDQQVPLCLQCGALHQSIIDRQIATLERQANTALDQMEMVSHVRLPGRYPPRPAPVILAGSTFHNINIKNSNVGVVNTGTLTQVDTAVSVIAGQGDRKLANAINSLTDAVIASANLNDQAKKEGFEILSALSTEATARKSSAARLSRVRC